MEKYRLDSKVYNINFFLKIKKKLKRFGLSPFVNNQEHGSIRIG